MAVKIPDAFIPDRISERLDAVHPTADSGVRAASSREGTAEIDRLAFVQAEVSVGAMGRQEAAEALLRDVMSEAIVCSVPPRLRAGLSEALETLLETDPSLRSLLSAVSPR